MKTYTTECHCTEGHIASTCFVHNALRLLGTSANYISAMVSGKDAEEACEAFCEATKSLALAMDTGSCSLTEYSKEIDPN